MFCTQSAASRGGDKCVTGEVEFRFSAWFARRRRNCGSLRDPLVVEGIASLGVIAAVQFVHIKSFASMNASHFHFSGRATIEQFFYQVLEFGYSSHNLHRIECIKFNIAGNILTVFNPVTRAQKACFWRWIALCYITPTSGIFITSST
mgnify:CR=1 FL=1